MNGLDRILEQIKNDSDNAVKKIKDEADNAVRADQERISKETAKTIEEIAARTKAECADIEKRGESSAALVKKQATLAVKQSIISDMIQKAHARLLSMPDDEYFDLIEKMIKTNAHAGEKGSVKFNSNDIKRMPQSFKAELAALSGGGLTLSEETAGIDGGFILVYGGIEENCSFDAVFSEKHDELQDEVYSLLFS